jgi:mono/diheme cytochrome c family protein
MLRQSTLMYVVLAAFASGSALADDGHDHGQLNVAPGLAVHAVKMVAEGQHTFRFDTFGDEDFWTGTLKLNQAIATVSPATALSVGLKVDVDALPRSLIQALKKGQVDLNSPATTLALLQLNAVIGVTGTVQGNQLTSLGVQCALCHSTVDNSFAPGIGHRLDGWANRDLDIGTIISLAPDLSAVAGLLGLPTDQSGQDAVRAVLKSWGPGKFDAELFMDGKAFNGNKSAATLIPPAFGLAGVNLHTWTGWGSVPYWNAFVANLEMHGKGTFFDPRLADPVQFPIAAKAGFDDVRATPDLITGKLAALQFFQLALDAPPAPRGSFDAAAAQRGQVVFDGAGKCATCHVPPLFTEPGWNMHKPEEIGVDAFQADRAPDHRYRTSPLKGLWTHMKGGFYHDGRFATLNAVVDHYNTTMALGLSPAQENDLVEYLKSL